MKPAPNTQIVFIGFDLSLYHTYKSLNQVIRKDIKSGKTRLLVINPSENFYFDGWGTEITTEIIQPKNVCYSLSQLLPNVNLVVGKVIGLDKSSQQIQVEQTGRPPVNIHYNHLIISQQANILLVTGNSMLDSKPDNQKEINTALQQLVARAATAKNIWEARRLFQVVITGNLTNSREWAIQISEYLSQLSQAYPSLSGIQPGISLVGQWSNRFSSTNQTSPAIEKYVQKQLNQLGIHCFEGRQVVRENADGVVLSDGSFIACNWVLNCEGAGIWPACFEDFKKNEDQCLITDKYSRLLGESNIWAVNMQAKTSLQNSGKAASYQVEAGKKGKHLGLNLLNALSCQMLRPYSATSSLQVGSLGSGKGLVKIGNMGFTGNFASWLRLFLLLKAMPTRQSALACLRDWISFFIWRRQRATVPQNGFIAEKTNYRPAIQTAV